MADLDDFFAKKDKKKTKGKKFTTTGEIAKKLEETGRKVDKPKPKEKPPNPEGNEDGNQQIEDDDEWKEFEEEKKDYTGLKIGNLTVTEGVDDDANDDRDNRDTDSDRESGEGGSKSGPWKKTETAAPVEQPPPVQQPQAPPAVKLYKVPMKSIQPTPNRHRKNVAPDIHSEEYFPTLNSKQPVVNDTGVWGRKKRENEGNFEEVRNRGGTKTYAAPDSQSQAPKLSLGNKYGMLPQDQS